MHDPTETYLDVELSGLGVDMLPNGALQIYSKEDPLRLYVIERNMIRQSIVDMVPIKGGE